MFKKEDIFKKTDKLSVLLNSVSMILLYRLISIYVVFDEIKWLCAFAKYITLKFTTEPQSMFVNKLILTLFNSFGIECKKTYWKKALWKYIFKASTILVIILWNFTMFYNRSD